jgi:hypothetical protein
MNLASKFGIFRKKMQLDEMPAEQALFAQGCWLAGAQASFQILAALSESNKSAAEVQMGWAELQDEIMKANEALTRRAKPAEPEPEESLIQALPEKKIIVC